MRQLTIHLESAEQETAVRQFLDTMKISYEATQAADETEYLTSSPEMVKRLHEAKAQQELGEGVKITLDDIWK